MQQSFSVMAVFCEDIREEKAETVSLIGVLPDHMIINKPDEVGGVRPGSPPRMLTKIGVYGRINFDPNFDLPPPRMALTMPDGQVLNFPPMTEELVSKAKREAKEKGNPLAGLVIHGVIPALPAALGILKLEISVGEETYLAGAINFAAPAISSSETVPPSQQ